MQALLREEAIREASMMVISDNSRNKGGRKTTPKRSGLKRVKKINPSAMSKPSATTLTV